MRKVSAQPPRNGNPLSVHVRATAMQPAARMSWNCTALREVRCRYPGCVSAARSESRRRFASVASPPVMRTRSMRRPFRCGYTPRLAVKGFTSA